MSSLIDQTPTIGTSGFWPWFFQRISGALLLFLVLTHGIVTHFLPIEKVNTGFQEEAVMYEVVKQRLTQGIFVFLDFSLLFLALYHGLNGIRNILMEWAPAAKRQCLVTICLWVLGTISMGFGTLALLTFIL